MSKETWGAGRGGGGYRQSDSQGRQKGGRVKRHGGDTERDVQGRDKEKE